MVRRKECITIAKDDIPANTQICLKQIFFQFIVMSQHPKRNHL